MKQAIYEAHGPASDVIKLIESKPQQLTPGQSRVKILRAPINPSDIYQVAGTYGQQPPLPAAGGLEGIGEVVEVMGEGLERGTLVLLPNPPGSWSTEKVVPSEALVPLPKADIDQLSMLAVNPATAYLLLTQYVDLKEGDWIIQSAANSAVGRYVTQLAKARGIHVASVVRRESAVAEVLDAGADAVFIDGPDLADRVAADLDKAPVLALDAVASETTGHLAMTLEDSGTIVVYGGLSGSPSIVPDAAIIFNNVSVRGFWLLPWIMNSTPQEQEALYRELTRLIIEGKLNAPIERVFPLEDINEALALAMQGGRSGKVLIAPNGI